MGSTNSVRWLLYAGAPGTIDTQTAPGSWQSQTQYLLTINWTRSTSSPTAAAPGVERGPFDAWGKRRKFDWTVYTASMPFGWQGLPLFVFGRRFDFLKQFRS
ncbi:hypothetical protein [Hyphomicrobium sp. ghe19]|uniref:hypothetical protein n=1 Tax=Hyphomicrobium sp. ghe19 TaxID=2682968 RepID=UPI0030CB9798